MSIIVYRQDCSMCSLKKTRYVCIFLFSFVKYQFYIHFQNKYQLGVRPLDPLLGLHPWTPLGDFRFPGYLPLCVNPSSKVTEPLTPLAMPAQHESGPCHRNAVYIRLHNHTNQTPNLTLIITLTLHLNSVQ